MVINSDFFQSRYGKGTNYIHDEARVKTEGLTFGEPKDPEASA